MFTGLMLVVVVLCGVLALLALMLSAMDMEKEAPSYRDIWLDHE